VPDAVVEDLDGRRRDARPYLLAAQGVVDRVVVAVDLDVIVDVDLAADKLGQDVRRRRQRLERRALQPLEELATADAVHAHAPVVQLLAQLGDPVVHAVEGEERVVPQTREDPSLGHLHADLGLRLVPRLRRTRRQDDGPVVPGELLVGSIDARLVAAGNRDGAPQLVGHERAGHAVEVRERAHVAPDPVGQRLRQRGLGVRHVRRAEHHHEQLDGVGLAGLGIDQIGPLAGVVDESLLARVMRLPEREAARPAPPSEVLAELRATRCTS